MHATVTHIRLGQISNAGKMLSIWLGWEQAEEGAKPEPQCANRCPHQVLEMLHMHTRNAHILVTVCERPDQLHVTNAWHAWDSVSTMHNMQERQYQQIVSGVYSAIFPWWGTSSTTKSLQLLHLNVLALLPTCIWQEKRLCKGKFKSHTSSSSVMPQLFSGFEPT